MTAIDDFLDDAHACLVRIQARLNKLGSINITLPMRDHLTPEETQDALASLPEPGNPAGTGKTRS